MKIFGSFISQRFKLLAITTFTLFSFISNIHAQEGDPEIGGKLFKANCASCHFPDKDMTGPALQGARERWIESSTEENFYAWIKNSGAVIKSGDGYANQLFNKWNKTPMTPQSVSDEDIDNIFAYVESYTPPPPPTGATGETVVSTDDEGSSSFIWWVIAILLLIVIGAVGTSRGYLSRAIKQQNGEEINENETVSQAARRWAWDNRGWFGVVVLVGVVAVLVIGLMGLMKIGVFEDYKPEQPIKYSHKLHAGDLGIDCKYCHNAAMKSKHATIPTVNVCMNCHSQVHEGTETGTTEISKIHEAAGFDPETRTYSGETKPIKWVKVHNLPDHVYFNHSQHVNVGGVDCAQCHGDMKKETVARVMTTEDLNAVEENEIKFSRPTLTMGWCIECHQLSNVDVAGSHIKGAPESEDTYYGVIHQRLLKDKETYQKYLEDDVISVAELGGWECAKCHY
ncbi:c-type cytochrome [Paracrocinitomix mangrovi]|uniref:c-type cytochrome n=1 Tax=Paracrocinitomix mangrovi TaxID=2862509 RepID=UPI001C8EEAFB|nr:c-type cytochrome [Paracrocinitomix mangrovi]UKN00869.1 c-type cytochrome [Paracrocinitomix mangrovi]